MLFSHFTALAFLSTTAAVPASPGVTQLVWQIVQNPLREEPLFSAPAVSPLEEIPSTLQESNAVELLYTFDDKTVTLENVAARSNGHLIVTATSHPDIYSFNPHKRIQYLLYTIPGVTSTLGIVEITPDVFIVAAGNYTENLTAINGTFSIWSVDLKNYHDLTDSHGSAIVKKITNIPEAQALNGMTKIEGSSNTVLVADSALGAVWRVDVTSGKYSLAIKHLLFSCGDSPFPLGINGIRTYEEKLWFVNSAQKLYGHVDIDNTGAATGEPKILAHCAPGAQAWDDVAIDWEANGWIATHADAVTEVTVGGKQRNFTAPAGANYAIRHPTSLVFGRGSRTFERTLFVVTAGASAYEPGGQTPGQILAVDTRQC